MQYTTTIEIDQPRERVIELMLDPGNSSQWQPTLMKAERLEGDPGQEGSQVRLVHKMGGREIEMIETIVSLNLPDSFEASYEGKGVFNLNVNRFEALDGGRTRWELHTAFRFTGLMRLIGRLFSGMFKKQTGSIMKSFKDFAESVEA